MLVFPVPVCRFTVSSGLVNGAVGMGVCTKFLVDGVDIILGNNSAVMQVWTDGPLPNVITKKLPSNRQAESVSDNAVVYPACAVTCAMASSRDAWGTAEDTELEAVKVGVTLPEQFRHMSRPELAIEQRNDTSLKELFDKCIHLVR